MLTAGRIPARRNASVIAAPPGVSEAGAIRAAPVG